MEIFIGMPDTHEYRTIDQWEQWEYDKSTMIQRV